MRAPWDSDRLAVFRAVAREGSFSRAAVRLGRSQPAVSQALSLLEDEVGEPLLLRLGRRVTPTASGRLLLEHVDQAFEVLEAAKRALEGARELRSGRVALATSDTNACYVLPPVLRRYRERHPGVELCLSNRPSPAAVMQVRRGEVDLAFATLPVSPPGLSVEVLCAREDVAICAPDHPLAGRKRLRFEALLDYPLLLLDRGSQTRTWIDERIAATGRPAEVAMELASIEVVKKMVELDLGVSVVPRVSVAAECERGSLCAIPVFARRDARSLGLVLPSARPPSAAAAALADLLRESLRARV